MAWLYVACASLLEVIWVTLLKRYSFSHLWVMLLVPCIVSCILLLLNVSMKLLPVGTAYGVFVGLSTIGVMAVGIFAFGESASLLRLLFLGLILIGVVGLRLLENPATPAT